MNCSSHGGCERSRHRWTSMARLFSIAALLILMSTVSGSSKTSWGMSTLSTRGRATRRISRIHRRSHVLPTSYRSQGMNFEEDRQHDEPPWYRDKRFRPWKVDFTPQAPGKYSLTSRLVITNVAVYILQVFFPAITQMGIKLSDRVLAGEELYRLVTPMFLHGGLTHLLTNTFSLQSVGHDVERYFGGGRFLATYLVSGVAANLVSAIKTPNPSLGASGAVFGIIGSYLVFLNRNADIFGRRGEYMAGAVSRTIMMNLILGAMSPMVDNWSHVGGAVAGGAMAFYFGPRLFVGELPGGGRTIVDRPILRLPRSIEAIPEKIGNRAQKMKRRMQIETFKPDRLETRPWRKTPPNDYRRRRSGPEKSVRPRF